MTVKVRKRKLASVADFEDEVAPCKTQATEHLLGAQALDNCYANSSVVKYTNGIVNGNVNGNNQETAQHYTNGTVVVTSSSQPHKQFVPVALESLKPLTPSPTPPLTTPTSSSQLSSPLTLPLLSLWPNAAAKLNSDAINYLHRIYCRECRMEEQRNNTHNNNVTDKQTDGGAGAAKPKSPPIVEEQSLQQTMDKNKESLKRKLMLRRSVNELVDQGIYPPLKTPPAFAEQRKQLERAKTGDILRHKLQHRPDRQALVQTHILEDTSSNVDPSLQEKQRLLKKARLQDSLNEQLAHRPGPLELVQSNILQPIDNPDAIKDAIKEGKLTFTKTSDLPHHQRPAYFPMDSDAESSASESASSPMGAYNESSSDIPMVSTPPAPPPPPPPDIGPLLAKLKSAVSASSSTIHHPMTSNQQTFTFSSQSFPQITPQSFTAGSSHSPGSASTSSNSSFAGSTSSIKSPGSATGGSSMGLSSQNSSSNKVNKKKSTQKVKSSQKNKVIKFHEYKGPPNLVKNSSSSSSPVNVSSIGIGLPVPAVQTVQATAIPAEGTTVGTPYNVLLQQQQLFLQWQLEVQQKSMTPIIFPQQSPKTIEQLASITPSPINAPHMVVATTPPSNSVTPQPIFSPVLTPVATPQPSLTPQPPPTPPQLPPTPQSAPTPQPATPQPTSAPVTPAPPPPPPVPSPAISKFTNTFTPVSPQQNTIQIATPIKVPASSATLSGVITFPTPVVTMANTAAGSVVTAAAAAPQQPQRPKYTKLEDMKVAELKVECKKRNLPVSGPKPNLLERLKPHTEAILGFLPISLPQSSVGGSPITSPFNSTSITSPPSVQSQRSFASPPSVQSVHSIINIQPVTPNNDDGMNPGSPMSPVNGLDLNASVASVMSQPLSPPEEMDITNTPIFNIGMNNSGAQSTNKNQMTNQQSAVPMSVDQAQSRPASVAPMDIDLASSQTNLAALCAQIDQNQNPQIPASQPLMLSQSGQTIQFTQPQTVQIGQPRTMTIGMNGQIVPQIGQPATGQPTQIIIQPQNNMSAQVQAHLQRVANQLAQNQQKTQKRNNKTNNNVVSSSSTMTSLPVSLNSNSSTGQPMTLQIQAPSRQPQPQKVHITITSTSGGSQPMQIIGPINSQSAMTTNNQILAQIQNQQLSEALAAAIQNQQAALNPPQGYQAINEDVVKEQQAQIEALTKQLQQSQTKLKEAQKQAEQHQEQVRKLTLAKLATITQQNRQQNALNAILAQQSQSKLQQASGSQLALVSGTGNVKSNQSMIIKVSQPSSHSSTKTTMSSLPQSLLTPIQSTSSPTATTTSLVKVEKSDAKPLSSLPPHLTSLLQNSQALQQSLASLQQPPKIFISNQPETSSSSGQLITVQTSQKDEKPFLTLNGINTSIAAAVSKAQSVPSSPVGPPKLQRSATNPFFTELPVKDPPKYDEAMKNKQNLLLNQQQDGASPRGSPALKSQAMDDVLEILIRHGELPPSAAQEPPPTPHNTSSPAPATTSSSSVSTSTFTSLLTGSRPQMPTTITLPDGTQSITLPSSALGIPGSQTVTIPASSFPLLASNGIHINVATSSSMSAGSDHSTPSPAPSVCSSSAASPPLINTSLANNLSNTLNQLPSPLHSALSPQSFKQEALSPQQVDYNSAAQNFSSGNHTLAHHNSDPGPMDMSENSLPSALSDFPFITMDWSESDFTDTLLGEAGTPSSSDQQSLSSAIDSLDHNLPSSMHLSHSNSGAVSTHDHIINGYSFGGGGGSGGGFSNSSTCSSSTSGTLEPSNTDNSMNLDVSDWLDVIMPSTGISPLSANAPVNFSADPVLTPKPQDVLDLFNMEESDLYTTPTDFMINLEKAMEASSTSKN